MKHSAWEDWSDAEILAEVHKLKKQGFGTLTIEIFEHTVRVVTPAPQLRKPAMRTDERSVRV